MSITTAAHQRRRISVDNFPETKTQQHHKDDVNLPRIMMRFKKEGVFHHVAKQMAAFGDFTDVVDFQEAQNIMAQARQTFLEVPPKIREKYNHDPMAFADAAMLPENKAELASMGFDTSYLPEPEPSAPPTDPLPPQQNPAPETTPDAA